MNGDYRGFKQVLDDIRNRRHLEAYSLFIIVAALTAVNLVGPLPNRFIDSAILASLALLIYYSTRAFSQPGISIDAVLSNRERLSPLPDFFAGATEFCMYAPTGINTIPRHAGDMKAQILARGGRIRIIVMDPASPHFVTVQDHISGAGADANVALDTSLSVLNKMTSWGDVQYRLLHSNPGVNLVIVDPGRESGKLLVEFHGFNDNSVSDRMHIIIKRSDSLHWFDYWVQRFEAMWEAARVPSE